MTTHPAREGLNLLDGSWYAADPHEIWTWRRREAPVCYDEAGDVWGISRYDDVHAIFDAESDVFWAPVNTVDDLLADEQFRTAGGVVYVADDEGSSPMLASPADFGAEPVQPRWRAPRLGEHTAEILRELGRTIPT